MDHFLNVCDVRGDEVEAVDLICFGSPCQDLSCAGLRKGIRHEQNGDEETTRSGLFMEAVRIIKEMREKDERRADRGADDPIRPRFAIWENVVGAFSSSGGEDFRIVLEELARVREPQISIPMPKSGRWRTNGEIVGDGWSIAWRVLDAQFHGVPQRRRRVFLVCDFAEECAGKVLFECQGLPGYPPQSGDERKEIASGIEGSSRGTIGNPPYVMQVRCGKEGGGKGALIQTDKAPTITATKDTTLFQPIPFGISSYESNSMKSANPDSGIYKAETSRTLDLNGGNPACNQGGLCVVEPIPLYNHPQDSALRIEKSGMIQTLTKQMGTGGNNVPLVAEPIVMATGQANAEIMVNKCSTLTTVDEHPIVCYPEPECYQNVVGSLCHHDYRSQQDNQTVSDDKLIVEKMVYGEPICYAIDRGSFNSGKNAKYQMCIDEKVNSTLTQMGPSAVCMADGKPNVRYIVRRLTPTECARLQGMQDDWCRLSQIQDMSDEDFEFWTEAHKVYAEINGKKYKAKTKKKMINWYNRLRTDGAEYKAYGNGMALPCARVPVHGVAGLGAKTMASLFDGIGGFPLCGILEGIETRWTSEIELFPIAVTKERFGEYAKYKKFTFGKENENE